MSNVYHPSTGLLALDPPTLAAVISHARGQSIEPAARRSLDDSGMLVADQLDAGLHSTIAPLLARGPRIRMLSRARGQLTVTDAAFSPAAPDGPDRTTVDPDHPSGPAHGAGAATLVVRPPDSTVLHVRHTRAGAATRALAASLGLGPHVLVEPLFGKPLDLRDWATVRSGFDSARPSGWVQRRDRAELHEVRWAPTPGTGAATALVVARLDGGLAEIRPRDPAAAGNQSGVLTVTSADTTSLWRRLCVLTTGGAPWARPDIADPRQTGRQPGQAPVSSS